MTREALKLWLRRAVRLFWGSVATGLILLALLVQLGRQFGYLAGNYREPLADYWSAQLGMPVTIAELDLDWRGLRPELRAKHLEITSADGDQVAVLDALRVKIKLLPSLFQLRLVVADFEVRGVQLDFEQQASGHWRLEGLPQLSAEEGQETASSPRAFNPFDAFLFGRQVRLKDTYLELNFRNGEVAALKVPEILLENGREFHRLSLRMDAGEQRDMVTLVVEGRGDPRDSDNFVSRGYLRVLKLPTERLLSAAVKRFEQASQLIPAEQGAVDLELWFRGDYQGYSWQGKVAAEHLPRWNQGGVQIDQLQAVLQGRWWRDGSWQLALQDTHIDAANQRLDLDLSVGASVDQPLRVHTQKLPLAALVRLLGQQLASQPEPSVKLQKLHRVLSALNPRGQLHNLEFKLPATGEFSFAANLDQVAVDAWKGVPALKGVDGYVYADKRGGRVELDSRSGFSMHYSIYEQPMEYRSAKGTVAWHLRKDDNAIYVNSSRLSLRGDDGAAEGYLLLDLPWVKGSRAAQMILQIGLVDSAAKYYQKYVPAVVPEHLRQWLDDSIGGGRVPRAGFIYRGSLAKGHAEDHTIQLALELRDGELDYHPRWPALKVADAGLIVDDHDVHVRVQRARLLDSQLAQASVDVVPNLADKGMIIHIDGELAGPSNDGLTLLRDTMLRDQLGSTFDNWQLDGQMRAEVELAIPLLAGAAGAHQRISVQLADSDLRFNDLNLQVDQLRGELRYDDRLGLSSTGLDGQFFGEPLSLTIASDPADARTTIAAQGRVGADALGRWSRRPEVKFLAGTVPLDARLDLFLGREHSARAKLQLSSDLVGASIDLPQPFAKPANEPRDLQLTMTIDDAERHYRVALAQQAEFCARQSVRDDDILSMSLGLNQPATDCTERRFDIGGQFASLNWGELQVLYRRYQGYSAEVERARGKAIEKGELAGVDAAASLPVAVDVMVAKLAVGEQQIDEVAARGRYGEGRWDLNIESPLAKGNLQSFDDGRPLQLALDYLHLPKREDSSPDGGSVDAADDFSVAEPPVTDPLAQFDPRELPALDFYTAELKHGDNNYGSWRLQLRPIADGTEINGIFGQMKGIKIAGIEAEQGARLRWTGKGAQAHSYFVGSLTAADLNQTLSNFDYPDLIDSKQARFEADLGWRGSPAAIGLLNLDGRFGIDMNEGRFLRATGSANNPLLKLVGLLNFDTLARRLKLDFSDMYKSGMVFDSVEGDLTFAEGELLLQQPLKVRTPSSRLQLSGVIDLRAEQMDTNLVAALPISNSLALLTALTAGLPVAAGVYVAGKLFEEQVDKFTSVSYSIKGSWDEPEVKFERVFGVGKKKQSPSVGAVEQAESGPAADEVAP